MLDTVPTRVSSIVYPLVFSSQGLPEQDSPPAIPVKSTLRKIYPSSTISVGEVTKAGYFLRVRLYDMIIILKKT